MVEDNKTLFARCARMIAAADALLITAGAGLGVDSGLPDFRGSEGMWRAYPALGRAGLRFEEIANPAAFARNPRLAWGFYGHRLQLYRSTTPGSAFCALRRIARTLPHGAFVFTSNVDGHFQRAGFDSGHVVECHGSIHHLQCTQACAGLIWPADDFQPEIDAERCELIGSLPCCPRCGALARPNILMFGDWQWVEHRTQAQYERLQQWRSAAGRLLVIELGAGTAVPTVRNFSERQHAPLLRINLREAGRARSDLIPLPLSATVALEGIFAAWEKLESGGAR